MLRGRSARTLELLGSGCDWVRHGLTKRVRRWHGAVRRLGVCSDGIHLRVGRSDVVLQDKRVGRMHRDVPRMMCCHGQRAGEYRRRKSVIRRGRCGKMGVRPRM